MNSVRPDPPLASLLDSMAEGVYFVDLDRIIHYWNPASSRITGYPPDEVLGRSCMDNLLVHCDRHGRELCENGCPLTATMRDGQVRHLDAFLKHRSGHRVAVRVQSAPLRDSTGEIFGVVETFHENEETLAALALAESYRQAALTDALTGAASRLHGQQHLQEVIRRSRTLGVPSCIALFDIDRFKQINDTFGHPSGDAVLQVVSKTLRSALRASDFLARWGGEEFLLILEGCQLRRGAVIADECRALVAQSRPSCDRHEISVTISGGITEVFPSDSEATVLRRADRLLYLSKSSGRNRVSFSS